MAPFSANAPQPPRRKNETEQDPRPGGGFIYTPEAGFSGADSFEYTIADAFHLYKTEPAVGRQLRRRAAARRLLRLLAGPVPGHPNEFFGLEDRGPNVESPLTTPTQTIDVLPKPSYDPSIARFSFEDGEAELVETIPLRDSSNSEITALSNNTFLIDERDSGFPSATGYKKLWEVNLEADHIKPVSATLYLDIDQLLTQLNPTDAFFDHDKVEGVSALEGGKRIVISNDNDGHDQRERSALSPEVNLT